MATDMEDLIGGMTARDLDALDKRSTVLRRELAAVDRLRKELRLKLKSNADRKPATTVCGQRITVAKYLLTEDVALQSSIASSCEIPVGSMTSVLAHEWFKRTGAGIVLTPAGRQAARMAPR